METVELEARFLVVSFASVVAKLKALGAPKIWSGTETVRYFDTEDGAASAAGKDLRWKFCPEYPDTSHRVQQKTKLPDYDDGRRRAKRRGESLNYRPTTEGEAHEVLQHLSGGKPVVETDSYRKRRHHYEFEHPTFGHISVELDDQISALGERRYVEIEGTIEAVDTLVSEFGFDWKDAITIGYLSEVKAARRAKRG